MTSTNSTISGNTADGAGGGAINYGGTLRISNSTIVGNRANASGGTRYCPAVSNVGGGYTT